MRASVVDLIARNPEGISPSCIVEDVAIILAERASSLPFLSTSPNWRYIVPCDCLD